MAKLKECLTKLETCHGGMNLKAGCQLMFINELPFIHSCICTVFPVGQQIHKLLHCVIQMSLQQHTVLHCSMRSL